MLKMRRAVATSCDEKGTTYVGPSSHVGRYDGTAELRTCVLLFKAEKCRVDRPGRPAPVRAPNFYHQNQPHTSSPHEAVER